MIARATIEWVAMNRRALAIALLVISATPWLAGQSPRADGPDAIYYNGKVILSIKPLATYVGGRSVFSTAYH